MNVYEHDFLNYFNNKYLLPWYVSKVLTLSLNLDSEFLFPKHFSINSD